MASHTKKKSKHSTKKNVERNNDNANAPISKKRKRRAAVQVFECPSAFPGWDVESLKKKDAGFEEQGDDDRRQAKANVIDLHAAAKEVRELGSTAFKGHQLKTYRKSQYKEITGREMKEQKRPLKYALGMKKKQEKRDKQAEEEAKASGMITASSISQKKKKVIRTKHLAENRKRSDLNGPAPSIGFMKGGMLQVKK